MLDKIGSFLSSLMTTAETDRRDGHTLQLATAVLLVEVMQADANISAEEVAAVTAILREKFSLTDGEVGALIALGKRTAQDANDFHQFTSLLNRELDLAEKVRVIEYMWQVAYADRHISAHENHLMRKIADLLYIPHGDYVAAKARAKILP